MRDLKVAQHGRNYSSLLRNSTSLIIFPPRFCAFSYFDPAPARATIGSVFWLTHLRCSKERRVEMRLRFAFPLRGIQANPTVKNFSRFANSLLAFSISAACPRMIQCAPVVMTRTLERSPAHLSLLFYSVIDAHNATEQVDDSNLGQRHFPHSGGHALLRRIMRQ